MEELKQELERVLREEPTLAKAKIELETTVEGRVGGFIISGSFGGMPQTSRQDFVWNHIERKLARERHLKIVSLLTLTPAEAEDDDEGDDVSAPPKAQPSAT